MTHWSAAYVGMKYDQAMDCFAWFCHWRAMHFGDTITLAEDRKFARVILRATHYMTQETASNLGWMKTDTPVEGDAAYLTQGTVPHHIGMVVFPAPAQMRMLHALERPGVMLSTLADLRFNGWRVKGYYTPCK